jgi:hypothetical protein
MPYGKFVVSQNNLLEVALARAASDPASRPEFYKLLLESEVFVIGHTDAGKEGSIEVPAGAKLSIVNWQKQDGSSFIPFFSSINSLQNALKEEANFVAMPARSFFEATRGATLVMNPASNHGKEFFPHEIEALLATGLNHTATRRTIDKAATVLLGQPAKYPSEMVASLTRFLAKHPTVQAAYLCLMQDPAADQSLVVGFLGDGDLSAAMREAGAVAADTAMPGTPVDFVEIKRGEKGIGSYFLESVQPFYQRSFGTKLRSMFAPGRA